jgi:hypothetical protein
MLEIREDPEFLAAYGRLWHDLSEQIAVGREQEIADAAKEKNG